MNKTKTTILGLGLAALAPLASAQTAPAQSAPAAAPAAAAPAQPTPAQAPPSPEEIKQVFSYMLGYQFGIQLSMDANTLQVGDFDQATFFKAVGDGLKNKVAPEMEDKDVNDCMSAFVQTLKERSEAEAAANLAKGKAFLAEHAKQEGVTTTKSGLQYKVLTKGEGRTYDAKKDGPRAEASITYEGRLIDGTVFDATDEPISMPIDRVVPGFSEALKLMPIGSEWEIVIPSELGYGEQAPGVIGNNSTLIFKLKLHDIQAGRGTPGNPIELTPELQEQLKAAGLQQLPADSAPAK